MKDYQNRIVGHGEKPANLFKANLRNWRKHPKTQKDALHGVLSEVGWVQDVIVNSRTGTLIDGHARIELALKQGDKSPVPYIEVDLSEAEEALILASLDPLSAMATADSAKLDALMREVKTGDAALQAMLADLAKDAGLAYGAEPSEIDAEPQVDKAEELREKWGVESGKIWKLGDHKLACGDCTDPAVVARLMGEEKAKLLVTDPPYGISIVHVDGGSAGDSKAFGSTLPGKRAFGDWGSVQRGPKSKNQIIAANRYPVIEGDDKPFDPKHLLGVAEHTVIFGANYFADKLPCTSGWICWDKREQITRNSFADCELAWTSESKPARVYSHLWNGLHKGSQHGERRRHPTEKPVALFSWIIEQYTDQGDIVCDWYLGSGTTLIACENLGRKCRAIEVAPGYTGVALQRFFDATGIAPLLINDP